MAIPNSLTVQVGGSHYKKYEHQPLEFAEELDLSPIIFCIFKYVCRYKDKAKPVEDLQKALHCINVFIEIGKVKPLLVDVYKLMRFLGQFHTPHSNAIAKVLQLQSNKAIADDLRKDINYLLELAKC